jgi:hypothetical protein
MFKAVFSIISISTSIVTIDRFTAHFISQLCYLRKISSKYTTYAFKLYNVLFPPRTLLLHNPKTRFISTTPTNTRVSSITTTCMNPKHIKFGALLGKGIRNSYICLRATSIWRTDKVLLDMISFHVSNSPSSVIPYGDHSPRNIEIVKRMLLA